MKSGKRTSEWVELSSTVCRKTKLVAEDGSTTLVDAPEAYGLEWRQSSHEFIRADDGAECCCCNLTCAPSRVAKASKGKCPT
eukprot:2561105-Heterocapsa_arctica.AAC.1